MTTLAPCPDCKRKRACRACDLSIWLVVLFADLGLPYWRTKRRMLKGGGNP